MNGGMHAVSAMSGDEGLAVADQVVAELRKLSYDEFRQLIEHSFERMLSGRDGKEYQVGIEALWTPGRNGNIESWLQ